MQTNSPDLWKSRLPHPKPDGHKYDRGHCIVIGGDKLTGAARLASEAAARTGAGLTTIIASSEAAGIYRAASPAHIMIEDERDPITQLEDKRRNVLVLGPGLGSDSDKALKWLKSRGDQRLVLDADGLRTEAMKFLREGDVLTPHAAEYKKLFASRTPQEAASALGCTIILKGEKTIITDGARSVVNDHASPYLASAGTGDVLAGIIAGLMAQGMESFDAACAAVWMHGEAGRRIGPGLVASDLPGALPAIMAGLLP